MSPISSIDYHRQRGRDEGSTRTGRICCDNVQLGLGRGGRIHVSAHPIVPKQLRIRKMFSIITIITAQHFSLRSLSLGEPPSDENNYANVWNSVWNSASRRPRRRRYLRFLRIKAFAARAAPHPHLIDLDLFAVRT